jgi:hypothetical protein
MDEYPEPPEVRLPLLTQADLDQAHKEFSEWAARYLTQPSVDLAAMPSQAFMAGYAFASQWWRD